MDSFYEMILYKTWQHIELSFIALFLSICISIPLGIFLAKSKMQWLSTAVLKVAGILQTIPGLALLALIIVFFSFLRPIIALPTTGFLPGIVVLVLYSLLPLVSNTYTGIKQVPYSNVEVAQAMGMTKRQVLLWIELPLSLPVIIAGIRLALVWIIGMVTLTSLVGSGGLGDLILQGLRTMQVKLVIAGTVPAAILAIIFDVLLSSVSRWILPETRKSK